MNLDPKWVPMKWPCGPLEIARRSKSKSIAADLKEMLEASVQPSALGLLQGTPVNCLVVDWANGGPEDANQQAALKPLLEAGHQMGISFVGRVAGREGPAAAVAAARAAGLAGVILAKPPNQPLELPHIMQLALENLTAETATDIFSTKESVWPGLNLETMSGDTAQAAPTGSPWVNSNAWFALLAEVLAPGKRLWLEFDPPESSSVSHPANYGLAVADSWAYGSRWIISLDDSLRVALVKGDAAAKDIWAKLCGAVAFFENHSAWENSKPLGMLAIVSDFRGDNAYLSEEVLNLLNRQTFQFQILERSNPLSALPPGVKAILWLDKQAPGEEQHAHLLDFVRQGGLLISAAYWGPADVQPTRRDPSLQYLIYNVGKGQMAVAEGGFQAPDQVAGDSHLLVSRRNDLVRLYNPSTVNCLGRIEAGGKKQLIHVLNYSVKPADGVTLWVNAQVRAARFWSMGAPEAAMVQGVAGSPGTEFALPQLAVYCAFEFEGSNL
jgi:hypothetical protein